eukprot:10169974-Alexandrium_andersonii.AAC.1
MTPHPGLALPLRNRPVVLRRSGHDEVVREARGAAELAAGWVRRKRTDVRVQTSRIEVGHMPGQADDSAQVVYDMAVRISGRAVGEAAGAVKERWSNLESSREGNYFGWADDA